MASLTQDLETAIVQASVIDKMKENFYKNDSMEPKLSTIGKVGGIYCHICKITFTDKRAFVDHYKMHGDEELVYTCVVCHKQIKLYPSFRSHCYTVHVVGNKNRCRHCYKAFTNSDGLEKHIKAKHSQPMQCLICLKEFTSNKELQVHQIIHDKKDSPPYNCQICKVFLPTLDHCKSHAEQHTMLIYYCPICNEFLNKQNATAHLKEHFDNNINRDKEDTTQVNIKNEKAAKMDIKDRNATEENIKNKNATEENIRDKNATEENTKDKKTTDVIIKDKNAIKEDDSDNSETSVEQLGIACDYCMDVFKNKMEFDGHFSEEHEVLGGDLTYVCVVCKKKFNKYRIFASHVYNHASKARLSCNICHKRFGRLSKLALHTAECVPEPGSAKPYACSECGNRYSVERSLRKHLSAKHGIRRVQCPVENCRRTFAKTKEMVLHQYDHRSEQVWCRRCGMFFASLAACEQHLEVHRQTLHSCPICSRDYRERTPLMNHIEQHFESVIFMCKVCGKVFNQRRRFVYHMETHSDKQTHACTYCDKSFKTPAQLRVHLNTHTGSKPYECAVCHKAFGNYANLSKHKRRMHMKINGVTSENNDDTEIYSKSFEKNECKTSNADSDNLNTPKMDKELSWSNKRKRPKMIEFENKIPTKRHSTFDVDVDSNSESNDDDESLTNEATNKNNNLNTPNMYKKLSGSNQYNPNKIKLTNKISKKRHSTSDVQVESIKSINDPLTSDAINKNNKLNTPKMDEKLGESNQCKRRKNPMLEFKIYLKRHPTSDTKPVIDSRNFEEHKLITSPLQNSMLKPNIDNSDIEPEPIDCIDLEKELQLIENTSNNEGNGDTVYGDALSTSDTVFDYVGIEEIPDTGSSEQINYPQEYGPEFTFQDSGILNLDDHMLPHIDPLLTIKTVDYGIPTNAFLPPSIDAVTYQEYQTPVWEPPVFTKVYPEFNYHGNSTHQEYQASGWEPPIFTKVCPEYSYYGDMVDSNHTSMMNTDIF